MHTNAHTVNGYLNNYKKYVLLNVSVFTNLLTWESLKSVILSINFIPQQTCICNTFNQIGTFDIIYINTQNIQYAQAKKAKLQ